MFESQKRTKMAPIRRLKSCTPAWLLAVSLLWPGILCADLELKLQPPVGKSILSWSPEQQLQGYGSMASIFPTRPITASGIASSLPSVGILRFYKYSFGTASEK